MDAAVEVTVAAVEGQAGSGAGAPVDTAEQEGMTDLTPIMTIEVTKEALKRGDMTETKAEVKRRGDMPTPRATALSPLARAVVAEATVYSRILLGSNWYEDCDELNLNC